MAEPVFDSIWINAHLATMCPGVAPYGAIADGALAVTGERIAWVGAMRDLPAPPERMAHHVHDVGGRWITPGLVDCHTHLVYAGDRAREFELRLTGATYEQIARAGGGIRSTVAATRAASAEQLFAQSKPRLDALMAEGVTTVEIKSGYGLDTANEIKMLRTARQLGDSGDVSVVTSFLGAHALPAEFADRADAYIELVCEDTLPAVGRERLADAVDVFCENIGFTLAQTERVFRAAAKHGIRVKLHAEQLTDMKGAVLAAQYRALSCDHLEYVQEDGVAAMAKAGCVAVLLPGAFYFLREKQSPPMGLLRRYEVPMALASDCNPGSSPVTSLLLMLNMACTLFRMTPEEALAGVTRNGARALGLADRGMLAQHLRADFVVWDISSPAELSYRFGFNPARQIVFGGDAVKDG